MVNDTLFCSILGPKAGDVISVSPGLEKASWLYRDVYITSIVINPTTARKKQKEVEETRPYRPPMDFGETRRRHQSYLRMNAGVAALGESPVYSKQRGVIDVNLCTN